MILLGWAIFCWGGFFCPAADKMDLSKAESILRSSCVDVVYQLQYDEKGNVPDIFGLFCSSCSDLHDSDLTPLLADGRDLLITGFLVGEKQVVVPDVMIDPAAIKSLSVRFNGNTVKARTIGVFPVNCALLLELDAPLPGSKVLKFDPEVGGKLYSFSRIIENGFWVCRLKPFTPDSKNTLWNGTRFSASAPANSLIINENGVVASMLGNNNEFVGQECWDLLYTQWKMIGYSKFMDLRKQLEERMAQAVIPATIHFKDAKQTRRERLRGIEPVMEHNICVFKMPGGKLFMPVLLAPQQVDRIAKVVLHLPDGDVDGRPVRELNDFGGLEIALDKPVDLLSLADRCMPLESEFGYMVWSVSVNCYSKSVKIEVMNSALVALRRNYRNCIVGEILSNLDSEFIFSLQGDLLGCDLSPRAFKYRKQLGFLDAVEIERQLNDPTRCRQITPQDKDPDAYAFMGIEYQVMNRELASSLKLQHLTNNGSEGLVISHIYPGSCADKNGFKNGDILLKIIIPNGGAPLRLAGGEYDIEQEQQFPWAKLDEIPEMYFGDIPEPWRGIKDPLNQRLSSIGIGREIEVIAICGGKLTKKRVKIEAAPEHFLTAEPYVNSAFGLEVRDITFELRHYFRMTEKNPGVIVSNVFAGSQASVAGLRPFEIITAVNDKPVFNIKEFQAALAGQSEVRLAVRRLYNDRVVTVKPKSGPRR